MATSKLLVKGMVCQRCVMTVKNELERLGHQDAKVSLGEVLLEAGTIIDEKAFQKRLEAHGFSLLEDKKLKLVKEVKLLAEEVYNGKFDFPERFRFSELVAKRPGDYETVSDAFIPLEKKTIEQFLIEYRINKVKEFLVYGTLSLSDIAFSLNFSSVAHLSNQFREQTGLTPSYFRQLQKEKQGFTQSR
jgi:AraC family transcriptional regulator